MKYPLLLAQATILGRAVLGSSQDYPEISPRIIGGSDAQIGRYPYALVSLKENGWHNCGGSLLAPDLVLTAAHCWIENYKQIIEINRYDLYDDSENFETLEAVRFFIHPEYDENTDEFDVMIIKLNDTVSVVDPVRINDSADVPVEYEKLTVVGWGAVIQGGQLALPDILQEVEVLYVPNDVCELIEHPDGWTLQSEDFLTQDMMCAKDEGKDACYGDSGGPLILRGSSPNDDVQVGVTSWGVDCAGAIPGVYNRLSYVYQWIEDLTCLHSDSPPEYLNCAPSAAPSGVPSRTPSLSMAPSRTPSQFPSSSPSRTPSVMPSTLPTASHRPSEYPSVSGVPSNFPTASHSPSEPPSNLPTATASHSPSEPPSNLPTATASHSPSEYPSESDNSASLAPRLHLLMMSLASTSFIFISLVD